MGEVALPWPIEKPHAAAAVLLPMPMQGHINPMRGLAKLLASQGFQVFFINVQSFCLPSASSNPPQISGPGIKILDLLPPQGQPLPECQDMMETIMDAIEKMRSPFERLLADLTLDLGYSVSCIVVDSFVSWAQDVADQFRVPRVAFWTSCAACEVVFCYLPRLISEGYVPLESKEHGEDDLIPFMNGMFPLSPKDLPVSLHTANPLIEYLRDMYSRASEAAFSLVNSVEEYEPQAVASMSKFVGNYMAVGPLHSQEPRKLGKEEQRCLEWLDTKEDNSVLYIAFGTVTNLTLSEFEALRRGLEETSRAFLWVLSTSQRKSLPEKIIQSFLAKTAREGLGLVVEWAPQVQVLKHSSIGGFVTHCGWNSILESLSAGVPMLACPERADQNLNCKYLTQVWKTGIKIKDEGEQLQFWDVHQGISRLMLQKEGQELRLRAQKMRDLAASAVGQAGSSSRNLQAFAAALQCC